MSFFSSLGKKAVEKAYNLASNIEGGRDYVAAAANSVNSLVKGKDPRIHLKAGNIIQILSRASSRTIQIVVASTTNELMCDAVGGTGSDYPNAHWLVGINPNGHYSFHNNFNYLAFRSGKAVIISSSINNNPPHEAGFRVHTVLGSTEGILLESVHIPGYFLSFGDDGQPVSDFRVQTKERVSQFEIHLIDHDLGIQPEKNDQNIEKPDELPPPSYWEATAGSNRESLSRSS